jgi:hypothetical protein
MFKIEVALDALIGCSAVNPRNNQVSQLETLTLILEILLFCICCSKGESVK